MIENISLNLELNWSDWLDLNLLEKGDINIPNVSGVYEVRSEDCKECLDIGKATNLKKRFFNQLILGKGKHSTRDRMKKAGVNFNKLKFKFAETENPSAVEEYLHNKHKKEFGKLPKYVKKT
jgi:excinuclease UvrABC nuclease subunit